MDTDTIGEKRRTLGSMMEMRANKNSLLKVERFVDSFSKERIPGLEDDTSNVTSSRYR